VNGEDSFRILSDARRVEALAQRHGPADEDGLGAVARELRRTQAHVAALDDRIGD
jgi:hypothetical protein